MQVPHPIPDPLVDRVAHRLAVLGQPSRIRIIERLHLGGEMTVQALADAIGATQQNVSRHLGLLYECGMVGRRQEGRLVWYRLVDQTVVSTLDDIGGQVANQLRQSRFTRSDRVSAGIFA